MIWSIWLNWIDFILLIDLIWFNFIWFYLIWFNFIWFDWLWLLEFVVVETFFQWLDQQKLLSPTCQDERLMTAIAQSECWLFSKNVEKIFNKTLCHILKLPDAFAPHWVDLQNHLDLIFLSQLHQDEQPKIANVGANFAEWDFRGHLKMMWGFIKLTCWFCNSKIRSGSGTFEELDGLSIDSMRDINDAILWNCFKWIFCGFVCEIFGQRTKIHSKHPEWEFKLPIQ